MMIRSDEAKTWRYRGKNVNQLKSLTLKAFSRPVLYTRGIMDQLSNWFVSDRRSDQGVDLTQLSSMAFLGLLPNQWSWHSDWRTLDAGKIHFVFCNSFSAYFHFERSIQYPGWQSFVFLFQYMQHQQQDVFVFVYIHKYSTSAGCSFLWTLHPDWQKLCVWPSQHFSSVLYCTSALGPSVTCPS